MDLQEYTSADIGTDVCQLAGSKETHIARHRHRCQPDHPDNDNSGPGEISSLLFEGLRLIPPTLRELNFSIAFQIRWDRGKVFFSECQFQEGY